MKNLFKKNNCHANIKFVERTFTIHFNYNFYTIVIYLIYYTLIHNIVRKTSVRKIFIRIHVIHLLAELFINLL